MDMGFSCGELFDNGGMFMGEDEDEVFEHPAYGHPDDDFLLGIESDEFPEMPTAFLQEIEICHDSDVDIEGLEPDSETYGLEQTPKCSVPAYTVDLAASEVSASDLCVEEMKPSISVCESKIVGSRVPIQQSSSSSSLSSAAESLCEVAATLSLPEPSENEALASSASSSHFTIDSLGTDIADLYEKFEDGDLTSGYNSSTSQHAITDDMDDRVQQVANKIKNKLAAPKSCILVSSLAPPKKRPNVRTKCGPQPTEVKLCMPNQPTNPPLTATVVCAVKKSLLPIVQQSTVKGAVSLLGSKVTKVNQLVSESTLRSLVSVVKKPVVPVSSQPTVVKGDHASLVAKMADPSPTVPEQPNPVSILLQEEPELIIFDDDVLTPLEVEVVTTADIHSAPVSSHSAATSLLPSIAEVTDVDNFETVPDHGYCQMMSAPSGHGVGVPGHTLGNDVLEVVLPTLEADPEQSSYGYGDMELGSENEEENVEEAPVENEIKLQHDEEEEKRGKHVKNEIKLECEDMDLDDGEEEPDYGEKFSHFQSDQLDGSQDCISKVPTYLQRQQALSRYSLARCATPAQSADLCTKLPAYCTEFTNSPRFDAGTLVPSASLSKLHTVRGQHREQNVKPGEEIGAKWGKDDSPGCDSLPCKPASLGTMASLLKQKAKETTEPKPVFSKLTTTNRSYRVRAGEGERPRRRSLRSRDSVLVERASRSPSYAPKSSPRSGQSTPKLGSLSPTRKSRPSQRHGDSSIDNFCIASSRSKKALSRSPSPFDSPTRRVYRLSDSSSSSSRSLSRSPVRSPVCSPSRFPALSFSQSPARSLSKSPARSFSQSPARSISKSPTRSISKSPARSFFRSPARSFFRSPARSFSRSPSRSPARRRPTRASPSYSPMRPGKQHVRASPSTSRSRSRSPIDTYSRNWSEHERSPPMKLRRDREGRAAGPTRFEAMEQRRVIYVGGIPSSYSEDDMRQRFGEFGRIEHVSLHFRKFGDNYGFVTFKHTADAAVAKEKGNDCMGKTFTLCYGGRRVFCEQDYADLDGCKVVKEQMGLPNKLTCGADFDDILAKSLDRLKSGGK